MTNKNLIKATGCILALTTAMTSSGIAFAEKSNAGEIQGINRNSIEPAIKENAIGYLTDENGKTMQVKGKLVSVSNKSVGNEQAATYEFTLYRDSRDSLTTESLDNSASIQAYVTINYSTKNVPKEYLLTGVSGYWRFIDSQVTVSAAELKYGCSGIFHNEVTQNGTKAVRNNFSYSTGFTKYVIEKYGVMGATLKLSLKRGTSNSWTFTLINNVF